MFPQIPKTQPAQQGFKYYPNHLPWTLLQHYFPKSIKYRQKQLFHHPDTLFHVLKHYLS